MKMKAALLVAGAVIAAFALGTEARATVANSEMAFYFSGAGFTGSGFLTLSADPTAGDPSNAQAITGITGTFSDSNLATPLVDESFTGVVAINPVSPMPSSVLGVASFSRFWNPAHTGFVSYDNLFYGFPGSPVVCDGYPFSGGVLDTYGALLTLANGDMINLWSNGDPPAADSFYGIDLLDGTGTVLDHSPLTPGKDPTPTGITVSVPEPSSLALFGTALLIVGLVWRRRPSSC